jgi:GrpE
VNRPSWRPALIWALGAGLLSMLAAWWLIPRPPDAFGAASQALKASGTSQSRNPTTGLPVFVFTGPARPPTGPEPPTPTPVPGPGTPGAGTTPAEPGPGGVPGPGINGPAPSPTVSLTAPPTRQRTPAGRHHHGTLAVAARPASPAIPPSGAIASEVARAYRYSSTMAIEIAGSRSFAIAPVSDAGRPSPVPLLLIAALLAILAALGGVILGGRRARWEPLPSTAGARYTPRRAASRPVAPGPATEQIPEQQLRRLRQSADQKTALARGLAELLPSMPEAVAWQAGKALADVGVRPVIPDGEVFDAKVHHAVGTEPVPPGGQENTIARTVRPGYADDQHILVYPKVVVYAVDQDGPAS